MTTEHNRRTTDLLAAQISILAYDNQHKDNRISELEETLNITANELENVCIMLKNRMDSMNQYENWTHDAREQIKLARYILTPATPKGE